MTNLIAVHIVVFIIFFAQIGVTKENKKVFFFFFHGQMENNIAEGEKKREK